MEAIAKTLDDQDILAVAAYYQQVPLTLQTVGSQGKD
jgi:cytochrome c553